MKRIFLIGTACIYLALLFSCKKDAIITSPDARLSFSADTLKFDTVFTTVGSVTQSFKIFNDNDQRLILSGIKLMGGSASPFKLNINGVSSPEVTGMELAANDSIYVFVTVTIDPGAQNLPFLIRDSIRVQYNGNERFVQLEAFGQDAHFMRNAVIQSNTTWPNDLPYVILGSLQISAGATLILSEGCHIYMHADAPFIVDGTLVANGRKGNEVVFTSDRLDEPYRYFPAGWPGIYLRATSINNRLNFAIIKNAYQALVLESPATNSNPKLRLQQCIIENASDAGILSYNSSITADNSLIYNCGKNMQVSLGGSYQFSNCTLASYSTLYSLHKFPVLTLSNSLQQNGGLQTADLSASFTNCILWGEEGFVPNEVQVQKDGTTFFNITFDHCLYRAADSPANSNLVSVIENQDPSFDSIDVNHRYYDFRITKDFLSPAIDQGTATPYLKDLDDLPRSSGITDLGSYEKQ